MIQEQLLEALKEMLDEKISVYWHLKNEDSAATDVAAYYAMVLMEAIREIEKGNEL